MKDFIIQYKLLIYPLVVGLASLVLVIFLILPQLQNLLAGRQNLAVAKTRLAILEAKAKELENLNEEDLSQKLSLALFSLPTDKDFASILGIFKELTSSSGMSLGSLRLAGVDETSGEFVIKTEVVGPSPSLSRLIASVELAPRVMRLKEIHITSGAANTVSATLTVAVFYARAPETLGPVEASLPQLSEKDQVILTSLAEQSTVLRAGQAVSLPAGKENPFE